MTDVAPEARVGDVVAVTQLVLKERQSRDRGWWDITAECFHPESTVELSWFRGSGAEFVASSAKNVRPESRPIHRIGPPAVRLCGERAVAENSGAIAVRRVLGGVEADMVSYVRGLYRCERHGGQWLIRSLIAIYEWDTLTPVVPGTELHVPREELERFRPSYRFLAYVMSLRGVTLGDDLYGEDRPEPLAQLYEAAHAWLRE
jgi:hypothetical protein